LTRINRTSVRGQAPGAWNVCGGNIDRTKAFALDRDVGQVTPQRPVGPLRRARIPSMRLYLINPRNSLVCLTQVKQSRWNRYRVWKPLGLTTLAGLTPPDWEIAIFDENVHVPEYSGLPRPDLVGITAFTSQAHRAYEVAADFRSRNVPVVMGGIHATMCPGEATARVDAVVTGEAEGVWKQVLADVQRGCLQRRYAGSHADMSEIPPARHDLLSDDYAFGAIQTTRGCPLNCSFCSVTSFNGFRYRQRPIDDVVQEFRAIREKLVLVVDDNLIGTSQRHIDRAKDLFRAMARAGLRKRWIAQVTINMADDEELLALAAEAGCAGVFIGFESPTADGLKEVGKKFNMLNGRNLAASVRRIQQHKILVAGSFIVGLDGDEAGIGRRIAETAMAYGVDVLNTLFLTPLPGTRLWTEMESQGRLIAHGYPEDWKYYTLTFPVARYRNFSTREIVREMEECEASFYSIRPMLRRVWRSAFSGGAPIIALVANLSYRSNIMLARAACSSFLAFHDFPQEEHPGNTVALDSRPVRLRDENRNENKTHWHGLLQPPSAMSHGSE
jgi:radical SAM superfamily enzyme YgiQ (UPF0313 family)